MRQSPPVTVSAEEGSDALESVRLELAQLHRDHHETKTLLQHLQEARLNPEDPALIDLRQRLDQALLALDKTGGELASLQKLPSRRGKGSGESELGEAATKLLAAQQLLQEEISKLHGEQTDIKACLVDLRTGHREAV